ncbi:MAG: PAS domain S-box protein, partial [Chitinophagaceae bacterium]
MVNQLPSPLQPASKILQKLASSLFMIVCAVDKEGRFVYINEASFSLLGYRPDELIGRSCYELMVEDEREATYEATDAAFHGAPITSYENHYYHKDGRVITMLWEGKWDLGDELVYTTGRDVTEQRRLERLEQDYQATLQRTTRQMEDLVDRITDGFLGLDENARVIYWNKAAEVISGLPQKGMIGNILWDVLPEPTCTLARQKLAEIKATQRPLHVEYFSERIERWMEVHAYISESGVSVFFRDVSERKELQEALIREKEERLHEKEEEQKKEVVQMITTVGQSSEGMG